MFILVGQKDSGPNKVEDGEGKCMNFCVWCLYILSLFSGLFFVANILREYSLLAVDFSFRTLWNLEFTFKLCFYKSMKSLLEMIPSFKISEVLVQ